MRAVLDFLGNHWREVAIATLLFVVTFYWWKDQRGLVTAYDATVESYETRIKELRESYQRETERKEAALEEFKEKVYLLETQYQDYKEEIDRLKGDWVEDLIVLRRDNPDQLILEIEAKFGFEHVE